MPLMVLSLVIRRIEEAKMPFFAKPVAKKIASMVRDGYLGPTLEKNIVMMEAHLAGNSWFAGDELTALTS